MMLQVGMYVRCAIDDEVFHRDFALGKINSINEFSELAYVDFYDVNGISAFYKIPDKNSFTLGDLSHLKIRNGAKVLYDNEEYEIKACNSNDDGYYYYYIISENSEIKYISESEITVSFNDGHVSPVEQLKRYEFQNPVWFLGRSIVSKTMHIINNSLYGFSEIAGCKIYLKTHQLRTVMRCLQNGKCRNMIADEVGMGKTIEAASVLKVFLKDNYNSNILILVPDALVEQWRTELAFKFSIFEGLDINNNLITLVGMSKFDSLDINEEYDFIIADEVHKYLNDQKNYNILLEFSKNTENILMLSATPVQRREDEYKKLLTLIQPSKYEDMSSEEFEQLLKLQNNIVRRAHDSLECLDSYMDEIKDSENEHTEDTEDAFDDLNESLQRIEDLINNEKYTEMYKMVNYEDEDFSLGKIQTALSFVCENYQFEKSIIRNRRSDDEDDKPNTREMTDISYDIQTNFNNTEYIAYTLLAEWIEQLKLDYETFSITYKNLISAFFSSAAAFKLELNIVSIIQDVPEELIRIADKWDMEEQENIKIISEYIEDPTDYESRMINIVDYIDQEAYGKKVLIFTNFRETFEVYKSVFKQYFGEEHCTFFKKDMNPDEREMNAYRFETNPDYWILLSDESGGEGRNFQNADMVLHIDIPWSANELEQRIGRLDRIGRQPGKSVISVACYAKLSLEEDLFKFWNEGLGIFNKSQSGLEIIMNDIDKQLVNAVCNDFKYGLANIIDDVIKELEELNRVIKRERYFDLAEYKYQIINQIMESNRELYVMNERKFFGDSMMGWSALSGFKSTHVGESVIKFDSSSFSLKAAHNSLFVPPDINTMIWDKINQIQNKVRALSSEKLMHTDTDYIQGTFDRKLALENDYIHFFAPGDEIFDSIVNNALYSYKGTCAAFACNSDIQWKGLIFTWILYPNETFLLENELSLHFIDRYKGFMPMEQFQCAVSFKEDESYTEEDILKAYNKILTSDNTTKRKCMHLGSRGRSMSAFVKGASSNIEGFRMLYPEERWNKIVDHGYRKAFESMKEKVMAKQKKQLYMLKNGLINNASAKKASAAYYGECRDEEIDKINNIIYKCFSSPKIILDSVCYVRMIKDE